MGTSQMMYRRSIEIENRLTDVLRLISTGRYSTPRLAKELRVSVPTVSRDVTALRERGYDIRAKRHQNTWCYVLVHHDADHAAPVESSAPAGIRAEN